jgi:hypothetical protein
MLQAFKAAHARSPEAIARKLVALVTVETVIAANNLMDEKASSAFLMNHIVSNTNITVYNIGHRHEPPSPWVSSSP